MSPGPSRTKHDASLEADSIDASRGTWRCLCGYVREVAGPGDVRAAELDVEAHVHGGEK